MGSSRRRAPARRQRLGCRDGPPGRWSFGKIAGFRRETSLARVASVIWCARVAKPTHSMTGADPSRYNPSGHDSMGRARGGDEESVATDDVVVPGIILGGKYRLIS